MGKSTSAAGVTVLVSCALATVAFGLPFNKKKARTLRRIVKNPKRKILNTVFCPGLFTAT